MTFRRSSGSSLSPSSVEPTRSMNITLRWRRSGKGEATPTGVAALVFAPRGAPQSPQNRLSGGLPLPQALHCHGKGDPQSPQNFLSFATLAPQRTHNIRVLSGPEGPANVTIQFVRNAGAKQGAKGNSSWRICCDYLQP